MKDSNSNNGGQKGTSRVLRVKVVNLLYLIFFVLAFLYIPADFVDVLRTINSSYENSLESYSSKKDNNLLNYNQVIFNYLVSGDEDSLRYLSNLDRVGQSSNMLISELENYKSRLVSLNGGYNDNGYLESGKAYNYSESFFLKGGIADSIHIKITKHKELIKEVAGAVAFQKIDSLLNDDEKIVSSGGKMKKWNKYYFQKMPVAGSVALLSKFQDDLTRSKNVLIESYIEEMKAIEDSVNISTFTKILADTILPGLKSNNGFVVKEKEFYRTGEMINFAIQIKREDIGSIKSYVVKDKRKEPLVFDVENNILKTKYFPYEEGKYSFHFVIGADTLVKTIQVREIKPLVTALGFNVFYAGIDNEVIIRHPNFDPDKLMLTVSRGVVVKKDSVFILNFRSGGKVDLKIYGVLEGKKVQLNAETMAVLELPVSQPVVNNMYDGNISREDLSKQHGVKLINEFTGFKSVHKVKGYKIIRVSGNNNQGEVMKVENKGAAFSGNSAKLINDAEIGDVFIFDDVKLENQHGRIIDAPSVVLTII
ncbi:MAG: hypothetical protein DRJ05_05200 [Bacteroidetes bacterium]|nr:MAG: hypothetical protein DRJ05_05200 [Bacteroidota bacterium]